MEQESTAIPVILLVGAAHSGSTLLDQIMDSHSQIAGIGELSQYHRNTVITDGMCSCGSPLVACEFWNNVFADVDSSAAAKFSTRTSDFLFHLKNRSRYDHNKKLVNAAAYVSLTETIYSRILKYSRKKIIFDSSKNMDRAEIINTLNSNLKIVFLHLVRDGRAVSYSTIRRNFSPAYAIKTWAKSNARVEIVRLRNSKTPYIYVRYEDFVKKPKDVLGYILRQVDQSFEDDMLNFSNKVHHQCGGATAVRLGGSAREIKLDRRWETDMCLRHKLFFNISFGWMNMVYKARTTGYM